MYLKHCKLSRNKQLELMKYFVTGSTARTTAEIVGVHRNTAIRFFYKLRVEIAHHQQNRSEQFCGKIELDESYFGGVRKGKRGRGAAGKVPVFGILKRNGNVYTQIVEDTKTDTLMPIIRSKIEPDSIFIQIVIGHIISWMYQNLSIIELITARYLLIIITT